MLKNLFRGCKQYQIVRKKQTADPQLPAVEAHTFVGDQQHLGIVHLSLGSIPVLDTGSVMATSTSICTLFLLVGSIHQRSLPTAVANDPPTLGKCY